MKNKLRNFISLSLVLSMGTGMLTACGNSDGSSSTKTTSDGTEVRTIQVALCSGQPPYTYADENGDYTGYDTETLKLVDELLPQYEFEYSMVDQDTGLVGTQNGKYQMTSCSYLRTDARAETYLLSDPICYYLCNLIVPENSDINGVEDLDGKTLSPFTKTDGLYAIYQDLCAKYPDIDIKLADTSSYVDISDRLIGTNEGRWDATIIGGSSYYALEDELGFKMKVLDYVAGRDSVYLINKDEKQLQEDINGAIAQLREEGKLSELSEQWLGEDVFAAAEKLGLE
ncbi:transporter substrate-binding domain-containing protein [uncultured Ruminococcus sp.]|uniref:transporter substrate-binding domain-containing protein n=1 Tax=uncultured Ruminococcus sp. TaxID=165186 RepID=UPI0025DF1E3D|nr:transporter substrate-binding domain-containing protein [uncultured Ruminococcus sp.]